MNTAQISDDGKYRYILERDVDALAPNRTCIFVMLNPSTADAEKDDPTIRRCIWFAGREGYRRLRVVNLYAYRATDPRELLKAPHAQGPENGPTLFRVCRDPEALIVAAWGSVSPRLHEAAAARLWLPYRFGYGDTGTILPGAPPRYRVACLGKTKDGSPRHPLYVRKDAPLEAWP